MRSTVLFPILGLTLGLALGPSPRRAFAATEGATSASATRAAPALSQEIASRRSRVEEFRFIRAQAAQLGVRVWLFGGTAAGFGHYVDWDLRREQGDPRFQKERFDYDYTNIYRSTQDLDIVVDGSAEKSLALQAALQERFPHFQGSRANWEVRPLREAAGAKTALLDNPDFLDQHSDTNSTGMIELSDPPAGEEVVRDLRDWSSKRPHFLRDLEEGRLHYYFSPRHWETSRAREGLNPPIFSVVRFLTKAFQYELAIRPEELARIRELVRDFDPGRDLTTDYARKWIEKNGKKLFQNAVNLEYAWNTLQDLGLREKLAAIRGDAQRQDSLAWWMNREPLRSWKLGEFQENDGRHALMPGLKAVRTAGELGLDVVSHETGSMLVYESITRSHTGSPNVFISREGKIGEAAAQGNAFYTRVGQEGARGTGITIRFHLDPRAREGVDFTRAGDYVMILNRDALRVIPESLDWAPVEFLEKLEGGLSISAADKGLVEKLNRRIRIKAGALTPAELQRAQEIVNRNLASHESLVLTEAVKIFGDRLTLDSRMKILNNSWLPKLTAELLRMPDVRQRITGQELRQLIVGARLSRDPERNLALIDLLREPRWLSDPAAHSLLHVTVLAEEGMDSADFGHHGFHNFLLRELLPREDWRKTELSKTVFGYLLDKGNAKILRGMRTWPPELWDHYFSDEAARKRYGERWKTFLRAEHLFDDRTDFADPRTAFRYGFRHVITDRDLKFLLESGVDTDPIFGLPRAEIAELTRDALQKRHDITSMMADRLFHWLRPEDWAAVKDRAGLLRDLAKTVSAETLEALAASGMPWSDALPRMDFLSAVASNPKVNGLFVPRPPAPGLSSELARELLGVPAIRDPLLLHPLRFDDFAAANARKLMIGELLTNPRWSQDASVFDTLIRTLPVLEAHMSGDTLIRETFLEHLAKSPWRDSPEYPKLLAALADLKSLHGYGKLRGAESEIIREIEEQASFRRTLPVAYRPALEKLAEFFQAGPAILRAIGAAAPARDDPWLQDIVHRVVNNARRGPWTNEVVAALAAEVMSRPAWIARPEMREYFVGVLKEWCASRPFGPNAGTYDAILKTSLSRPEWAGYRDGVEALEALMKDPDVHFRIARGPLSRPEWADNPRAPELIKTLIRGRRSEGDIVESVLSQEAWARNPAAVEFIHELRQAGTVDHLLGDLERGNACRGRFGALGARSAR